ncbi:four-carbon acid sugar kinase family protein [Xenorhabdus sp. DI]|uniref:3-oxo-tetronate kinase n=1 Tax=Xenorhabdus doucetiae TaxID=351671 RepID=UPI0019CAAA38|nr:MULTISPECIES: 3-oxo-tetronate kinase [unclassified Xenorhabdus]MBD2784422.1 four-carbon acid sugar kinase family protein [Xenorhabdus sp. 3]MBD2789453.1 four-carbon acid sugar kinase family protein [Xenorhabdus sp. DI]
MTIKLGVIADDFTGATDIASFMVQSGWQVTQLLGVPDENTFVPSDVDAVVISLKSRSCSASEAVEQSLKSCRWLRDKAGCRQFFFKYCSTFDSTSEGNIGPVIDALMDELQTDISLVCPALPVNGRTVVHGHLFVNGQLLNESGMQHHPVTPMQDANLLRLMEQQSKGQAGLINLDCVRQGKQSICNQLELLHQHSIRYVVVDAMIMDDLLPIAQVASNMVLVTGGSGLGGALANHHTGQIMAGSEIGNIPPAKGRKAVVLSGSCSVMTNQQVIEYKKTAPAMVLNVDECINNSEYADQLTDWVIQQATNGFVPMLYATQPPKSLEMIQQKYGATKASKAVEQIFAIVVRKLKEQGFNTFIVAGGETSAQVVLSLELNQFSIGASIAPGVPWVHDLHTDCWLALKSGNFGEVDFFQYALEMLDE